MRLLHLADLHLGRSLAEFSLHELQQEFLNEILKTVSERNIDAVLIAGDVYDRSLPPVYAVRMLNNFLCALSEMHIPVLIVSGNHDSAERLSFLSGVLNTSGIYIAGEYDMDAPPVTLSDEFGKINFYLLPFFRPGAVRAQAKDETIATYNDAVNYAVDKMGVQTSERNVLISHHFVTSAGHAPVQSDSEIMFIGGLEMVDMIYYMSINYGGMQPFLADGAGNVEVLSDSAVQLNTVQVSQDGSKAAYLAEDANGGNTLKQMKIGKAAEAEAVQENVKEFAFVGRNDLFYYYDCANGAGKLGKAGAGDNSIADASGVQFAKDAGRVYYLLLDQKTGNGKMEWWDGENRETIDGGVFAFQYKGNGKAALIYGYDVQKLTGGLGYYDGKGVTKLDEDITAIFIN